MFNQLTNRLSKTLETLRGIHRFTEDNIKEAIGDIRRALIEADVALPVVKTSVDIYRPAALEQLATLAKQINVQHFPSTPQDKPLDIVKNAIDYAKKHFLDVLIIDTAGRLHIDHDMMQEIQAISKAAQPTETLLVVDSMAGQDAANIAKTFNEQLALTGIVLT